MKKNRRNIINQVLWCILSALLGAIIGFYVDFFSSVNPNIEYIKNDLRKISEHSVSTDESIAEIINMYLKRDEEKSW